jgi:hypothetical protein
MKTFFWIFQALFLLSMSACSSLDYDSGKRVVIAPAEPKPISSIDSILVKLFEAQKPLVLYVHGRGNEPSKTKDDGIIEKLEKEYNAKVLMFNWDSYGFLLHRPVDYSGP